MCSVEMEADAVSPFELAVLVHAYLQNNGYGKTAASFKREAKAHFRAVPSTGVRDLLDLVQEYVGLKELEQRRLALAGRSTLAQRLLEAVDAEAAEQQAAITAAARAAVQESAAAAARQQEAAAAHHAQAQWLQEQQAAMAAPGQGARPSHAGELRQHFFAPDSIAAAAAPNPQVTPTRQRKAPPRKRQRTSPGPPLGPNGSAGPPSQQDDDGLGAAGDALAAGCCGGGSWGSPLDLLSLQLDTEGLEALLDDGPLQLRFAETLAQHINDNISGASGRPGSGLGACTATAVADPASGAEGSNGGSGGAHASRGAAAGSQGSGGFLAELLADPQTLLAELPADTQMAQVLQAVARPPTANPAPPPKPAARPASAVAERRQQEAAAAVVAVAAAAPGRRQKQHQPFSTASRVEPQHLQDAQQLAADPGQPPMPVQPGINAMHGGASTATPVPRDKPSPPTQQVLLEVTQAADGGAEQRAPGAATAAMASATAAARKLNEGVVELGALVLPRSDAELLADIENLF